MAKAPDEKVKEVKFGTFTGVFTPSVLTIIGVILFLRTGWVVGQTGLMGALAIIVLAHTVTIATGLSVSSISTNIHLGAGGAYTIIARSLGLEVGGAIGIPLYISQAISTAFYIAGFTEAYVALEASYGLAHVDPQIIAISLWAVMSIVAYIGADWAMKVQYVIMAAIAVSIGSFLLGRPVVAEGATVGAPMWTVSGYKDFFRVFAIFFPAVTGILAGVSMSGDLKDPRKSIPSGTMSAIGVGFLVYAGAAYWFGIRADAGSLSANSTIMIDMSLVGWTFYAGVFAATLSSALGSLVAAPRTLNALGEHGILPMSGFWAFKDRKGQPRNAVLFTSIFSLVFVAFGSLDTIAPLLTMFFLITYGMVNLVTFIESSIGITSFRPTFHIPRFVSLYGAASCFFIMIIVDPVIGTLAMLIIAGIYALLMHANLRAKWGDVRSGLFVSIAMWAARQAAHLPRYTKSWTPNLLLPVKEPRDNPLLFQLARDITFPGGSVIALTVESEDKEKRARELEQAVEGIREDKIFCITSTVDGSDFTDTASTLVQFLKNIFFRPNILLISVSDDPSKDNRVRKIIDTAIEQHMGIAIMKLHPKAGLNQRRTVNLVLRDKSPNKDLAILLALQLRNNWQHGKINLVTMVDDDEEYKVQETFFHNLKSQARLPSNTQVKIIAGTFPDSLEEFPRCDVAICGLGDEISFNFIRKVAENSHVSCLFVRDSGEESAFA